MGGREGRKDEDEGNVRRTLPLNSFMTSLASPCCEHTHVSPSARRRSARAEKSGTTTHTVLARRVRVEQAVDAVLRLGPQVGLVAHDEQAVLVQGVLDLRMLRIRITGREEREEEGGTHRLEVVGREVVEVDARDRGAEAGRMLERCDGEAGVDARHDRRVERDEDGRLVRGGL